MNQTIFKELLMQQNVQMDARVNFQANGDIKIYPCPWESEKEVTDGERVCYRAGIEVDIDGRTRVKRYNDGSMGPKQDTLFETALGAVKITRPLYRKNNSGYNKAGQRFLDKEYVYVTFKFPKKYGLALTKALYEEEADQIMSYFKTRKEETIWK